MQRVRSDPSRISACEISSLLACYPPPLRISPQFRIKTRMTHWTIEHGDIVGFRLKKTNG